MRRTAAVALWLLMGMALTEGKVRADITYSLDVDGETGSITTDGKTGKLSAGDILGWNIDIDGLVFSGSGANAAVGVSATSTGLQLDLTSTSSTLLLQKNPNNFITWTVATSYHPPEPATLLISGEANIPGPLPSEAEFNSTQRIDASTTTIASVPEPASATLGVLGAVVCIGYDRYRRRAQRRQGAGGQPHPTG